MEEAVFLSKKFTKQNGTVILSPGAPSYNLYKNFEERGDDFKIHVFK
jgi:UDP-N-acetylmuramoylalanine-D-glutamate ligase